MRMLRPPLANIEELFFFQWHSKLVKCVRPVVCPIFIFSCLKILLEMTKGGFGPDLNIFVVAAFLVWFVSSDAEQNATVRKQESPPVCRELQITSRDLPADTRFIIPVDNKWQCSILFFFFFGYNWYCPPPPFPWCECTLLMNVLIVNSQ